MSLTFAQLQKNKAPPPPTQAQIQKMLDENIHLIQTIAEFQGKGKGQECLQYQQILHRNLVYLASLADANQNVQNLLPPPQPLSPNGQLSPGPVQLPAEVNYPHQSAPVATFRPGTNIQTYRPQGPGYGTPQGSQVTYQYQSQPQSQPAQSYSGQQTFGSGNYNSCPPQNTAYPSNPSYGNSSGQQSYPYSQQSVNNTPYLSNSSAISASQAHSYPSGPPNIPYPPPTTQNGPSNYSSHQQPSVNATFSTAQAASSFTPTTQSNASSYSTHFNASPQSASSPQFTPPSQIAAPYPPSSQSTSYPTSGVQSYSSSLDASFNSNSQAAYQQTSTQPQYPSQHTSTVYNQNASVPFSSHSSSGTQYPMTQNTAYSNTNSASSNQYAGGRSSPAQTPPASAHYSQSGHFPTSVQQPSTSPPAQPVSSQSPASSSAQFSHPGNYSSISSAVSPAVSPSPTAISISGPAPPYLGQSSQYSQAHNQYTSVQSSPNSQYPTLNQNSQYPTVGYPHQPYGNNLNSFSPQGAYAPNFHHASGTSYGNPPPVSQGNFSHQYSSQNYSSTPTQPTYQAYHSQSPTQYGNYEQHCFPYQSATSHPPA